MGYGRNFYGNVCRLLSAINSGIVHRRPSVNLPLSKVGLELSQLLCNLGVVDGVVVGQRVQRVKGHGRLWEAGPTAGLDTSAAAAGFPAMSLTVRLNWDKHRPLFSAAQLAAAPAAGLPPVADASGQQQQRHGGQAAVPAGFVPPMSINSPTPERVRIISRPSVQRWTGVAELMRARAAAPPGVFLLSTHAGLLTDIDAELRGVGGVVLAHLQLPLGHVVQLRSVLRAKHESELAAAAAARGGGAPQHVPLARWDARAEVARVVSARLSELSPQGGARGAAYLDALDAAEEPRRQASAEAGERVQQLRMQELVWRQQQQQGQQGQQQRRGAAEGRRPQAAAGGRRKA